MARMVMISLFCMIIYLIPGVYTNYNSNGERKNNIFFILDCEYEKEKDQYITIIKL